MPDMCEPSKSYEMRQKMLNQQLKDLKMNKNPIVTSAIKSTDPKKEDSWEKFEGVEALMSAARRQYQEKGDYKQCLVDLAEAIYGLANKTTDDMPKMSDSEDDTEDSED